MHYTYTSCQRLKKIQKTLLPNVITAVKIGIHNKINRTCMPQLALIVNDVFN